MLFAAHQPHYLPWLRYLHKVAAVDVFVLLDDAQFTKNGWQNRTRIKGPQGPVLLTVPVRVRMGDSIRDARPADVRWVRRHLAALATCYGRAADPWRAKLAEVLETARESPLSVLNELATTMLLEAFDIRTPVVRSSELGVGGRGSERLAAIGRALGADAYLSGAYALDAYLDPAPFVAAGIDLVIQRWECPSYRQGFPRAGFAPDLSALDLLISEPSRARKVLMSGGEVGRDPALAANPRS